MKSNSSLLPVAAAFIAGLVAISGANSANAQSLDPQTGMPVFEKQRGGTHFDPASGRPGADATNEAQADQSGLVEAVAIESEAAAIRACLHNVVFQMSAGDYEKALQRCLTAQSLPKTESEAQQLFSQWAKLGRLYLPAKQALQKIRDEDTRPFSEAGGGSLILFSEVAYLNRLLQDEAATCALFKQIASQNPPLAAHFYPVAEDALLSQGEHLPQYAGAHAAEGELALACGMPEKAIHTRSPFMQVTVRIARGEYDQALRLIQAFCQRTNNFPAVATVLPDWMELARIYPPAMQTMIEVRERDTREFEQAKDGFNGAIVSQFLEASLLNNALGQTNATYAMCQRLEQHNPAQFQACFYLLEPLLMQHGDYQLCLKSIGDPQANLEMMRTNLEFMRKVLPRMREGEIRLQQQTEKLLAKSQQAEEERAARIQQFDQESLAKRLQSRQELWAQLRTNTPDADEMPLSPPPNYLPIQTYLPPRMPTHSIRTRQLPPAQDLGLVATNVFVKRVCVIVDILVASGHKAEAEKISAQAATVMDDPQLKSAVSDAEKKISSNQTAFPH